MNLLIRGGRVFDPETQRDQKADVLIEGDRIADIAAPGTLKLTTGTTLDGDGLWVWPGLIDLHVHLREPGQEYKEDIRSACQAAVAGGVTTVVAMPNTKPPIDTAPLVKFVLERGEAAGLCRVLPTGAVTVGQKGEELAPMREMWRVGAVGFTDDGYPVANAHIMRAALEYAKDLNVPILTHAEEPALSRNGDMHEGKICTELGLRGIPTVAETIAVYRDVALAEYTQARLHICHVSAAGSVDIIREAKARGVQVTAEAAPHHFTLVDQDVGQYQTYAKMNPPLKSDLDRASVIAGLADGTIDAIATNHAPHSSLEKDVPFAEAACGIIGLQTLLPLSLALQSSERITLLKLIERMTLGPAKVLRMPIGRLQKDAPADIVVVDPKATWQLSPQNNKSKSENSPWMGKSLTGQVVYTVCRGKLAYQR